MSNDTRIVVLNRGNCTTCTVNLHGATIVSWRIENKEQLFVSQQAIFDNKRGIRGGIPIIFPHYGNWEYGPRHGFARLMQWEVEQGPEELSGGNIELVLSASDSNWSRSMWDNEFKLTYRILLGHDFLDTNIDIKNTGNKSFDFRFLFHTYLKVPDVSYCNIFGFKNCQYTDLISKEKKSDENNCLTVTSYVNRVYEDAPSIIGVRKTCVHVINLTKYNLPDIVLWNPWKEHSHENRELDLEEYNFMICLKPGYILEAYRLEPEEVYSAGQRLKLSQIQGFLQ